MTDPVASIPAIVDDMLARRRRYLRTFVLVLVAVAIGSAVIFALIPSMRNRGFAVAVLVGIVGITYYVMLSNRYKAEMADRVMPLVAGTLGLAYRRDPADRIGAQSDGMLPSGPGTHTSDELRGEVAGREFAATEVVIDNGADKNRKEFFRGLVLELESGLEADFMLRPAKSGFSDWKRRVFGSSPDGMEDSGEIAILGNVYDLWTQPGAKGDVAVGPLIRRFADAADLGDSIEGVLHRGRRVTLAIRRTRGMFHVGGLQDDREAVIANVKRSLDDLLRPTQMAVAWHSAVAAEKSSRGSETS